MNKKNITIDSTAKEIPVKRITSNLPLKVNPLMALDAISKLVEAHHHYHVTVQVEKTKRTLSEDRKKVDIKKIETQREFLKNYLNSTFKERRHVIDEMFTRLDIGIETDNIELMNQAVESIVSIVKTSPLAEAKEVLSALNDPSVNQIDF